MPSSDTYIEKDASINEHIEQMRLSATKALLERPRRHHRRHGVVDLRPRRSAGLSVDGAAPGARRAHRPAHAAAAAGRDAVHAQRARSCSAAPFACAATSSTSSRPSPSARRCASSCSTTRSRSLTLFDPLTGRVIGRKMPRFTVYPGTHYVTPRERLMQAIDQIRDELRERLDGAARATASWSRRSGSSSARCSTWR